MNQEDVKMVYESTEFAYLIKGLMIFRENFSNEVLTETEKKSIKKADEFLSICSQQLANTVIVPGKQSQIKISEFTEG